MTIIIMDDANDGPSKSAGAETDRYHEFLKTAPRWLHYERANIDELTRREVNQLARYELARRDYDGPIEDDPRRVWAWLFISYVLRDDEHADEPRGGLDD